MRTSRSLSPRAVLAAVAVAAGVVLSAPGSVQAADTPVASTAAPGQGLEWFQARHGLPRTGS
ncbi:peptidoglycan-binding protein, partial [Streptomyces albidoflavus]